MSTWPYEGDDFASTTAAYPAPIEAFCLDEDGDPAMILLDDNWSFGSGGAYGFPHQDPPEPASLEAANDFPLEVLRLHLAQRQWLKHPQAQIRMLQNVEEVTGGLQRVFLSAPESGTV